MENYNIFKCVNNETIDIPPEVVINNKLTFPSVHTNGESMAALSKALKEYNNDVICRVPFCSTVEAESYGSQVKLGDENCGPRICKYVINEIEDLNKIKNIDFTKRRIGEVLKAVEILNSQGELVCLAVEGPVTIATSLMDSKLFYRLLRKEKDKMELLLKVIEDNIVDYILTGIKSGARIISYADPVGTIDMVGPKVYKEVSGKITYNILKRVEGNLENSIVHLCGKTSTSLESIGLAKAMSLKLCDFENYGEGLKTIIKEHSDVKLLGHWCIKRSNLKKKDNIIWSIKLN